MNNKYVVAVSGGVDSMYLANMLATKNQAAAFVHINHHTRGLENDYEAKLVVALAKKYELPYFIFDFNYKQGNFQAEAREFRYQKLVEVANQFSNKIAVAHHLDDQLENCLLPLHLVKSNLIKFRTEFNGCFIYRPLLAVSKQQIYANAKQLGIDYNEDISNQSEKYLRNYNRKLLKETKHRLIAQKNYIVEYNKLSTEFKNITELECSQLCAQSNYYRLFKLYQLIKSFNQTISVKNKQLISINKLIEMKKNSKYSITNCVELFIGYDKIYMLSSDENFITESSLMVGHNEFNGVVFKSERSDGRVRTWKHGDKVEIKNGHKKVSRIFIDNKVETPMRKRWPIIINSDGEIIEIPKLWRKNEIN